VFVGHRKFGKQIQKRQLDLPEYAASFLNYKALKKVDRTYIYPAL
jgi:CDK inhibitor PHO81